jgi:molybdenum cofactor cytidylyltransferase
MQPTLLAIIPAAGHSRRMGQPKLLLPWRGSTVIAHLVGELLAAGLSQILVVVRSSDIALTSAVESTGATVVRPPNDPPDMRSSVELGLQAAFKTLATSGAAVDSPQSETGWLLIPADHPIVSRSTVDALRAAWQPRARQILIPTYSGKRGHPTLFSGDFACEVPGIPLDCGLNWLVKQNSQSIREVPVTDPGVIIDLDTPEDYQALLMREQDLP